MRFAAPKLLVLSAPSGTGKSSIIQRLLDLFQGALVLSVSYTTRKPRPGETNGVDYHFIEKKEFVRLIHQGEFLEWAEVHGNFYGTSQTQVQNAFAQGRAVMLDIDPQGAMQLKHKAVPQAEYVFLSPPSHKVLEARLRGRGTETEEQIRLRLANAKQEMALKGEYTHHLLNDDLNQAILDFACLILRLCGHPQPPLAKNPAEALPQLAAWLSQQPQ